jgi:hypothetical protein
MTNPFLSTPEATAFWRNQDQACAEARTALAKHPVFARFLAAGGGLAVVPGDSYVALLKDGDSVIRGLSFWYTPGYSEPLLIQQESQREIEQLTAWLLEARDGARELPTAAQIARARIAVEVHDAPKRLEAPKYDIHKAC